MTSEPTNIDVLLCLELLERRNARLERVAEAARKVIGFCEALGYDNDMLSELVDALKALDEVKDDNIP